jgi:hypothetical protein
MGLLRVAGDRLFRVRGASIDSAVETTAGGDLFLAWP